MLIKSVRRWAIPEREATPEALFMNRRQLLVGGGAGLLARVYRFQHAPT